MAQFQSILKQVEVGSWTDLEDTQERTWSIRRKEDHHYSGVVSWTSSAGDRRDETISTPRG